MKLGPLIRPMFIPCTLEMTSLATSVAGKLSFKSAARVFKVYLCSKRDLRHGDSLGKVISCALVGHCMLSAI